ncbi:hypothetical protein AVEN_227545-1 [Araneus ventricosus]|uniref:Uncharacterized protein n=1 Tax=Araneus ventricosus TaxID=182803 RepID=A0A4Y2C3J0_ARAVE|nr:hypothetical protein AVEN_227545-1 [Araneus ventricosus]
MSSLICLLIPHIIVWRKNSTTKHEANSTSCILRQVEETNTCDGSSDPSNHVEIKTVMLTDATCYASEIVAPETVRYVESPSLDDITTKL